MNKPWSDPDSDPIADMKAMAKAYRNLSRSNVSDLFPKLPVQSNAIKYNIKGNYLVPEEPEEPIVNELPFDHPNHWHHVKLKRIRRG